MSARALPCPRCGQPLESCLSGEFLCPGCGCRAVQAASVEQTMTLQGAPATLPASAAGQAFPPLPGYEILEELGRGGMGVVYKARQTKLKRLVALKMILSGAHAGAAELARFRAEAESIARLHHPNIVQIYEIGEHDGLPFFSLEYVEGGTLAGRLAGNPLPPREAARLAVTLARAMQAAHAAGIVHRDLKPANVLLASGGCEPPGKEGAGGSHPPLAGTPKITDFGLAKTLDSDSGQTRTGAVMGTPSYMAPEQALGRTKEIGPRTDVYALGAILYEMLIGRPPFKGASVLETLEQVQALEPIPPRTLQPAVPRDLDTICLMCLRKEPAARYATAHDLADDLQRFLDNEPIRARPAGPVERAVKFVRRNRLLVGALAVIFMLLAAGIVATSVQKQRALQSAEEAREAERKTDEARNRLQVQLAQSHADRAREAVQRGRLREALNSYQAALDAGHPERIALRLGMARAHASLYQSDKVCAILDELQREPALGKHEGPVLLLRGYIAMGTQVPAALALIGQALKKELSPAERAFARGLLAETAPESVAHFQQALKEEPAHHASRVTLGVSYLLLGRTAEARELNAASIALYPEDPNFKLLDALLLALDGKPLQAQAALGKLVSLPARQLRALRGIVALLGFLHGLDARSFASDSQALANLWVRLAPDLGAVWPALPGKAEERAGEGALHLLQLPPLLNKSLGELIAAFTHLLKDLDDGKAHDRLRQALKKHPEGTLYYLHGTVLLGHERWKEAREQLLEALRLPGIGQVKRSALAHVVLCEAVLALVGQRDEAMLANALAHLRELLRHGPLRPEEWEYCAKVASNALELDLARHLIADWEKQAGPKEIRVHLMRLAVERKAKSHVAVLQAADRVLQLDPSHKDALAQRAEALKEIARLVQERQK